MRLHAYLAQAVLPGADYLRFAQLPGIKREELPKLAGDAQNIDEFVHTLEGKHDGRVVDVKKAAERWGKLELVDATFKGTSTYPM